MKAPDDTASLEELIDYGITCDGDSVVGRLAREIVQLRIQPVRYTQPIDRGVFLNARMAYLAHERDNGLSIPQLRDAVNVHDDLQAVLLLRTWDERRP